MKRPCVCAVSSQVAGDENTGGKAWCGGGGEFSCDVLFEVPGAILVGTARERLAWGSVA